MALLHSMWESRDLRRNNWRIEEIFLSYEIFHTENTNVTQSRQSVLLCQWHPYTPLRWSPLPLCQTTQGHTFLPDSPADASNTRAWLRKQENGSARRQTLTQMMANARLLNPTRMHTISLCAFQRSENGCGHMGRKLRGRCSALGQHSYSLL